MQDFVLYCITHRCVGICHNTKEDPEKLESYLYILCNVLHLSLRFAEISLLGQKVIFQLIANS